MADEGCEVSQRECAVHDSLNDILLDNNLVSDWSGVYLLSNVDKNVVFLQGWIFELKTKSEYIMQAVHR